MILPKSQSELAGSNDSGVNVMRSSRNASRTGCAICSARGVGRMPSGVRMNKSSCSIVSQSGQRMAGGGLAKPQASSRTGEVALLHEHVERDQQIEIDGTPVHADHVIRWRRMRLNWHFCIAHSKSACPDRLYASCDRPARA